jgi:hypothetical protein
MAKGAEQHSGARLGSSLGRGGVVEAGEEEVMAMARRRDDDG